MGRIIRASSYEGNLRGYIEHITRGGEVNIDNIVQIASGVVTLVDENGATKTVEVKPSDMLAANQFLIERLAGKTVSETDINKADAAQSRRKRRLKKLSDAELKSFIEGETVPAGLLPEETPDE